MNFLVIDEHASTDDLKTAAVHLRAKQRECRDMQVRDEIDADLNELIELIRERA